MNIAVTGAAGKLGCQLVPSLTAVGYDVRGIDRQFSGFSRHRLRVNLLDAAQTTRALRDAEAVVHLATHQDDLIHNTHVASTENVSMTLHVFEAARRAGSRIVVYASSIQVIRSDNWFEQPTAYPWLPIDRDTPAAPTNPYAKAKALAKTCYAKSQKKQA